MLKVLKIKAGNPSVIKKQTTNIIADKEASQIAKKTNDEREKISELEFIDQFISLMKVMPNTKQS